VYHRNIKSCRIGRDFELGRQFQFLSCHLTN
jgi:hypothetical protein